MIEHGITTSTADYWVHMHPLEAKIYGYGVIEMRRSLPPILPDDNAYTIVSKETYRLIDGKSKNGRVTGRGYLVEKKFAWVRDVPFDYLKGIPWAQLTDRELGLVYGEPVVLRLLNDSVIFPKMRKPFEFVKHKHEQFEGRDLTNGQITIEAKTEVVRSDNLFVQVYELAHDVHTTRDGETRRIDMPIRT